MKRHHLFLIALLTLSGRISHAAVPAPAKAGSYAVVYLRNSALWRQRVGETGAMAGHRVGRPERICALTYTPSSEWLSLTVSRNGARAAVDCGCGIGVFLVDLRHQTRPRFFPEVQYPTFSPDGTQLAVSHYIPWDAPKGAIDSISVLDTGHGNHWRTLCKGASQPMWSSDGREIVATEDINATPECAGGAIVIDAQTGKLRFRTERGISPEWPFLSPDGRYVAILHALSRPKTGHTLYDRRTGKELERDFDYPDQLPAVLEDWSPNGLYVLWNWRKEDPDNNGNWLWDEVGVTSFAPGFMRWIAVGNRPRFSPDSRFIAYLHPDRKGINVHPAALWTCSVLDGKPTKLIDHVAAFAFAP